LAESRALSVMLQPGQGANGTLEAGEHLRIVDVAGQQVFDIAFFLQEDPSEYCDLNYSLFAVERWYLTVGDVVYSKRMRPLLTVVADTCRVHDWIGGYCSRDLNRFLGDDRPGCREVLEAEMQKISLDPRCLVPSACLNPFMNLPHRPDGSWPTLLPVSKPGDYLELRAEAPVVWVGSVCTMPPPVNGLPLSPIRLEIIAGGGSSMHVSLREP
jgi:uncharacterized protein YcgI (DUF1989 family)